MATLEPSRDQIEIFVDALLRYAGDSGYLSLRAFVEGENRPFAQNLWPQRLNGKGLSSIVDAAVDVARRAANSPKPSVFCPPVAVFLRGGSAKQEDVALGLELSAELDQTPHESIARLEEIVGPSTVLVRSGGLWIDPHGDVQDKLHGHWRLARPARGDDLIKLKEARRLATRIAGGDPSNVPLVHPIRWPGSWHCKATPRLCEIVRCHPDREIDLDEALAALTAAAPAERAPSGNGADYAAGDGEDWKSLLSNIFSGTEIYPSCPPLTMKLQRSGMGDGAVVNLTRAVVNLSAASSREPDRVRNAYDKIPAMVRDGREKIEKEKYGSPCTGIAPLAEGASGISSDELRNKMFEPIKYIVRGVIVEGLTLLAAKPKIGKSWLMLHVAIAVARGGLTLGDIHCEEGDVLYCALEDNQRRLKSRMAKLLGLDTPWPARLRFETEMPRLAEGGLDQIKTWIKSVPHPRLVCIDTLAMVRAPRKRDESTYDADYAAVKEFRDLANEYGIAIVIVHHLRKAESDDPFDTVSGTLGLTGAPDTILILKRDTTGTTILHGRGRDLIEIEKAITFSKDACTWTITGEAGETRVSSQRAAILDALEGNGSAATPSEIAALAGLKHGNVKRLVLRMAKDGLLRREDKGNT